MQYLQKYEVQILDFYTNPRLDPDYGFWNDIFTLTKSVWKHQNYKGDADTRVSAKTKCNDEAATLAHQCEHVGNAWAYTEIKLTLAMKCHI